MIRIVPPDPGDPNGPVSPRRGALIVVALVVFLVGAPWGTRYVERWTDEDTAATAVGVAALVFLFLVAALVLVKRKGGGDR